jgi:hypothetical protein
MRLGRRSANASRTPLSTLDAVTADHRDDLDQLRTELERAKASETDTTELESLIDRLERHLDEDDEHDEPGMIDRLEEAVTSYEIDHPEATSIISRIIDTLSAAGL